MRRAPKRVLAVSIVLLTVSSIVPSAALTTALAVAPQPAPAPQSVPAVFAALAGSWEGQGELLGRSAVYEMHWEIGADGFVVLTFSNAWVGPDGGRTPVLASRAVYLPSGSAATGVWVDSRPQRLTLQATLTDTSVVTEWTAAEERGRTEYRVTGQDTAEVLDYVYVEGDERLFGRAVYRRVGTE